MTKDEVTQLLIDFKNGVFKYGVYIDYCEKSIKIININNVNSNEYDLIFRYAEKTNTFKVLLCKHGDNMEFQKLVSSITPITLIKNKDNLKLYLTDFINNTLKIDFLSEEEINYLFELVYKFGLTIDNKHIEQRIEYRKKILQNNINKYQRLINKAKLAIESIQH